MFRNEGSAFSICFIALQNKIGIVRHCYFSNLDKKQQKALHFNGIVEFNKQSTVSNHRKISILTNKDTIKLVYTKNF